MKAYVRRMAVLVAVAGVLAGFAPAGARASELRRVLSLDGTWELAEGAMDQRPAAFDHKGPVPGLVGMATPAFAEPGVKSDRRQAFWYRRTFKVEGEIPAVAELKVHKAMYGTRVWLNGEAVGEHVPCFTPGLFDVHSQLRGGGAENELVIRLGTRDSLPAGIPNGHDFEKRFYVPGIYDSVELILTGSPHVVRVQAAPDIEARTVRVQTELAGAADAGPLKYTIREAKSGRVVASITGEKAKLETIPIPDPKLWSPESPFLYELEVATPGDSLCTRFGMRSFRFDKQTGRAVLNGRPYYLRGTNVCLFRFFEDPACGEKPWSEAWVRKLHRVFRDMHWNSIRYCIGFPPEMWYRIADEEGLLIQDEFPIWHGGQWPAALKADELGREYTEWMQERWNHACVVIWDAQNESVTTETGKAIHAVRGLDLSNRPWDNGYGKPDAPGDSFESHPYVFNNPSFRLCDLKGVSAKHWGNARPNDTGNAMIINEYSWLWLNRDGTPCTLTEKLYENLLGRDATPAARLELYARYEAALTEYWRAQRRYAGVLHFCGLSYARPGGQTSDNFRNLETLEYQPGFVKYVRDSFAPVMVMIDAWDEELIGGTTREFPVVVINDLYDAAAGEVVFRLTREERTISEARQPCKVEPLGKTRLTFKTTLPGESGRYRLEAELRPAKGEPVRSLRDIELLTEAEQVARRGIAVGRPVLASSSATVGEHYPAEYAVDGNRSTRWSSEFSDPQWIAVDLGEVTTVSRVVLIWEQAAGKAYAIQVSTDGKTWKDVYKTEKSRGGRDQIRFEPAQARWVRMMGTKRATQFGYSLWEFQVHH